MFSSVRSTDAGAAGEDVHFTHLTRHWERAYEIAKLLVQFQPIRDEQGWLMGTAFTVPMDRVFEDFVQTMLKERLSHAGLDVIAQKRFKLTPFATVVGTGEVLEGIEMRPDVVVEWGGKTLAVADVKYKKTDDIGSFKQPDIYQLFTYCSALGVQRGLLIYADSQPHITQRVDLPVSGGHIDIDTISINLSERWPGVLEQVEKVSAELQAIAAP